MQVLLVVLAPLLVIAFAMSMEHIETRLHRRTDHIADPQKFIETHTPSEMLADQPHARA